LLAFKTEDAMRKIINSNYITLDGAVEDPHLWPSLGEAGEAESFDIQMDLLDGCDTILMGRRTYETFAGTWPTRSGDRMSDAFNAMGKRVASTTLRDPTWNNTKVIGSDAIEAIRTLKAQPGKDIVQYGIGQLTCALLEHGLVDELRLWIHPIILGTSGPGKPHFLNCPPTQLEFAGSHALANGIVIARYRPK
jgi:dihydrofolate reductase